MAADPLKSAALRLLARREHSRAELSTKLAERHGASPEQIAPLLDELAGRGLQSDARLAESVLASQARRLGPRRIAQTLRRKGLDEGLVAASVAQAREGELERAAALWRQRFGGAPAPQDPQARQREAARQLRFLLARGYSGDVAHRVLRQAGSVEADDPA
jgi:regulatory protein